MERKMINAEFVKEMKKELDILEMYQHEFDMAKEEGDSEDAEYFGQEIKQENAKIMSMFYAIAQEDFDSKFPPYLYRVA